MRYFGDRIAKAGCSIAAVLTITSLLSLAHLTRLALLKTSQIEVGDQGHDEMAWQKLHLAKVTYLLGKNSLFHSSWKMCAWHLLVCHTEALGGFLLLNHKSAVPRKFLIFVCPGCCNSIFFPIAGFAIVNQLLASRLNCCNMLIFELHLESTQELYLGSYSLPKQRMLLWAAVLQDPLLVLTWTACMGFTYRISCAVEEKDRAQIGAKNNGRTLCEELSASAFAWGCLGAAGRGALMIRTGCESFLFSQDFRKDGGRPDSFPQICCVWKDF